MKRSLKKFMGFFGGGYRRIGPLPCSMCQWWQYQRIVQAIALRSEKKRNTETLSFYNVRIYALLIIQKKT